MLFLQSKPLDNRFTPVFLLTIIYLIAGFLTRTVLYLASKDVHLSFTELTGQYAIGLVFDLFIASLITIPMVLHIWFTNEASYQFRKRPFVVLAYLVILCLPLFTQLVPKDFNADLRKAIIIFFSVRFILFILLGFTSKQVRLSFRKYVLLFDTGLYIFLILFNIISEYFFWNEFSSRYNFIAVDYLVYTTEVMGNIRESYPVEAIIGMVLLLTLFLCWLLRKPVFRSVERTMSFRTRSAYSLALLAYCSLLALLVNQDMKKFSRNTYANELSGNGVYDFTNAFFNNELDYFQYYKVIQEKKAFELVRKDLSDSYTTFTRDLYSIERKIDHPAPEKRMNVVLISVESFSASFMDHFGGKEHITPFLDSLADHSLLFTNLYASGTRTVRGLEALSLSLPPTPGQSVVKRPGNEDMFSLGHVFRSKGYTTQYIYGGYSYFDNMKGFFGSNEYDVIDREAIDPAKIHFSNIWGVCDEDLFTLALEQLDKNHQQGKNFFTQVMTVSNHRPFTYPEGRIDIAPARQVREGAVKYTDYSIGKFIREASAKPWFNNTIFVIVSDHCAGSAGYVELPVTGYHIPMMIYCPSMLAPAKMDRLTAQIDIAPTILGLLNFDYTSKFFGRDIFAVPQGNEHAFISTYQGLGYIEKNRLLIQSPKQSIKEYEPDFQTGDAREVAVEAPLAEKAIAYYQVASWLLKNKKQGNN